MSLVASTNNVPVLDTYSATTNNLHIKMTSAVFKTKFCILGPCLRLKVSLKNVQFLGIIFHSDCLIYFLINSLISINFIIWCLFDILYNICDMIFWCSKLMINIRNSKWQSVLHSLMKRYFITAKRTYYMPS